MLTSVSSLTLQACSSGGRVIKYGLDNGDGSGTAQNGILEAGEVDYTTTYCSNFVLTRLADINSGASALLGTYQGGNYARVTVMGTRLYYAADDGISGRELWAHETTNGSTWQVADINNGSSSYPGVYAGLTVMGTRLYFDADDGSNGSELWAHESTNSSTWQVVDIRSGSNSSKPGSSHGVAHGQGVYVTHPRVTVMGTRLYFVANDGISGRELWAHESTNSSTWQVTDILLTTACADITESGAMPGYNTGLLAMGTRFYFDADECPETGGGHGRELWAHETTNSSTWLVADINSGAPGSFVGLPAVMGTRLYFSAGVSPTPTSAPDMELWAHETTNSSTWQVAEINSGGNSGPSFLTVLGTRLFFSANDGSSGGYNRELWAHESTNDSTWQVADINSGCAASGSASSWPGRFSGITVLGTRLYFGADDGCDDYELWAHESTNGSTWQATDIFSIPVAWNSYGARPGYGGLTVMGTRLYFDAYDGSSGCELWAHESTNGSTWQVADINSDASSHPGLYAGLTVMGNRLYFDAWDGSNGYELWGMGIGLTITLN
jgi:ELWxxDGT repeat protein